MTIASQEHHRGQAGSVTSSGRSTAASAAQVAGEIAVEQAHVDRVYTELAKAGERAGLVEADGLARGRSDRSGEVRDEELTGLFERDALVLHATRRRYALESQYEGLVFGRLDIDHVIPHDNDNNHDNTHVDSEVGNQLGTEANGQANGTVDRVTTEREVRYIGRLGVRDDDYEPLVIDWRAPAASPFYRATPVEPLGVLRRRVLRCKGADVVGVEDDLMVPEPPDDLVVVGDGALMAALTRSRGTQMRDIVATIQADQDKAIRAPARGVTEITGGPGTGKTVVALHRAAYLLYSDRRRYESGGILVVGPSAAYTAYIERVLPSLGEETVALRSLGDVVDVVSTERLDDPAAAAVKGSLRIRQVLARAARDTVPGSPEEFRAFVAGEAIRLTPRLLEQVRGRALRSHQRNLAQETVVQLLADLAFRESGHGDRPTFIDKFEDSREAEAFVAGWWPQVDPREVLLWLADPTRLQRYAAGLLSPQETEVLGASMQAALDTGSWSVADVALIDDLSARLGPVQAQAREERDFYDVEEIEDLSQYGMTEVQPVARPDVVERGYTTTPENLRDRLLLGAMGKPEDYAHVLVDEAQDLSPMQWRMLGRRGRYSSWTVVGDAAQSSWPDRAESAVAREEAFGTQPRALFHMDTNYRNAREIFDYAAAMIRVSVPDADIPQAVRETGIHPVDGALGADPFAAVSAALDALVDDVEGSIAVITPARHRAALLPLAGRGEGRVQVIDPMSTKGLEYDATVVVDPDEIARESPGGVRVLYVAMTRAAHRMTVLR
ncbi:UvrD-helicase domain-containing protein [Lapillicoccus sp.]|uniref:HelD family protein n=1 Tax=Lapillicoccus sp. TaxID=1909287 RepID=UPI0025DFC028|nr:UvrD-helicase domain-containing protein [Lapillicoccus sp.]